MSEILKGIKEIRDIQGVNGNWNYDPYMQGLYNGLEMALAIAEKREPEFKEAPTKWVSWPEQMVRRLRTFYYSLEKIKWKFKSSGSIERACINPDEDLIK